MQGIPQEADDEGESLSWRSRLPGNHKAENHAEEVEAREELRQSAARGPSKSVPDVELGESRDNARQAVP